MSEPGYRGLCKSQGLRGKEAKKIEGERGGGERGRGGEGERGGEGGELQRIFFANEAEQTVVWEQQQDRGAGEPPPS